MFAEADQELLLDPPDPGGAATIGGVIAAGDSGPLRTRYGGPRDLVLGVKVALSDGQTARAGGKVIKNVAGYDLSKLFTGSLGSLGLILELSLRLHPKPPATATAAGGTQDASVLAEAARSSSPRRRSRPAASTCASEAAMARCWPASGAPPRAPARRRQPALMRDAGLEVTPGGRRRSDLGATALGPALCRRAWRSGSPRFPPGSPTCSPSASARAGGWSRGPGLGLAWVTFQDRSPQEAEDALAELRRALDPAPCAVLDAPAPISDPWPRPASGPLALMQRIKARFDPAGVCRPVLA